VDFLDAQLVVSMLLPALQVLLLKRPYIALSWFDLFVLDMKTETACEGKTLDLRCKKGMTIDIESAIYGRF
jgi:hypothetical protein